ncbi:MAG: CotH kinase family protein [Balneolales bacterium]|nr:CotH kinase family protein [Balneolales bacterium]
MKCAKCLYGLLLMSALWAAGMSLAAAQSATVVINEVMASNATTLADEDGDFEDWIELYNPTDSPVNLSGYALSDDYSEPQRWFFPNISIEPGAFLLVWASGKDRRIPFGELHTNFSIAASGEEILLVNPYGEIVDELAPTQIPTDISYGRFPDGAGSWQYFSTPTPGGPNEAGLPGLLPAPEFSSPPGFYNEPVLLELLTDADEALILYTLDGSEPDPANIDYNAPHFTVNYFFPGDSDVSVMEELQNRTFIYTQPLQLMPPADQPYRISDIITTYRRDGSNWRWQTPPPDLPRAWVIRAALHQADETGPVASGSWFVGDFSDPAFSSMPLLSVIAPPQRLFGFEEGIYVPGRDYFEAGGTEQGFVWRGNYDRRGREWEVPVHAELFGAQQSGSDFAQNLGFRIHGLGSRTNPNKSFRLYSRSEYDEENTMRFPFFPGETNRYDGQPLKEYNRLMVRSGGNLRKFLNDAAAHRILQPMELATQRARAVQHFMNGEYWGMMYLRDRLDRFHIHYNYGPDPDNVIVMDAPVGMADTSAVDEGLPEDLALWQQLWQFIVTADLEDDEIFAQLETQLDLSGYIDYLVSMIYWGNVDWYGNKHFKFWRVRETSGAPFHDGKWRMMVWDFDEAGRASHLEYDLLYNALSAEGSGAPPYYFEHDPERTLMFRRLLENEGFRTRFINRFASHINFTFAPQRVQQIVQDTAAELEAGAALYEQRWGYSPLRHTTVQNFLHYAGNRPDIQRDHIAQNFDLSGPFRLRLQTSDAAKGTIAVDGFRITAETAGLSQPLWPWTGYYFRDVPLSLTAEPGFGYAFSHWEGLPGGPVTEADITVTATGNLLLTAVFTETEIEAFPEAHTVGYEDFYLSGWPADAPAGSFPANMAFVFMDEADPGLNAAVAGFTSGAYNLETRTRINGLGEDGFAFINTGNEDGNPGFPGTRLGGALLALDTTGDDLTTVSWTGGTLVPNSRVYAIRLQYRIGDEGPFEDVLLPNGEAVEYNRSDEAGHTQRFENIILPVEAQNQRYVQLLWRYYFTGEQLAEDSGARDQLGVGEIEVSLTPAAIPVEPPEQPLRVELHQNYPNPFNPDTIIEFFLSEPSEVRLEVFNLTGRHVATLTDGFRGSGFHGVVFDGSQLSSGIYLYRLTTPSGTQTRKMTLVK